MSWLFLSNTGKRMIILMFGDLLSSMLSFYLVTLYSNIYILDYNHLFIKFAVFAISVLFCSFLLELYNTERDNGKRLLFIKISFAAVFSFTILHCIYYIIPYLRIDIKMLAFTLLIFLVYQNIWHILFESFMKIPLFARKILIFGTGPLAERIGMLIDSSNNNYIVSGYISSPLDPQVVPQSQVIGDANSIDTIAIEKKISHIVIALTERRGGLPISKLLTCKMQGIDIMDMPRLYELLTGKIPVENVNPSWLLESEGFMITRYIKIFKRVFDLFISLIVILIVLPLFPFIVLLVKLTSSGPVFYKQLRTGELEKDFMIYKFRTMKQDSEKQTGAVWAAKKDPRITTIGSFLRKTRIDELPQLYNVLRGDMSFIGPRPERPEFIKQIKKVTPFYSERHFVKPGITGWAQIKYPYGASFGDAIEKLRYDLYYVKNMSLSLDLMIILETIRVVLSIRGR